MVFIRVDAAEEDGAGAGGEVVEPEAVGGGLDQALADHGERDVLVRLLVPVLDLDFEGVVAEAHDAFGGGGGVADAHLEVGQRFAADGEGVGDVIAGCTGVVGVVDAEFGVEVGVGVGIVGDVGARGGAGDLVGAGGDGAVFLAEGGGGGVHPEVGAAGVDVEAEGLGGSADGDVGEVETSLLRGDGVSGKCGC